MHTAVSAASRERFAAIVARSSWRSFAAIVRSRLELASSAMEVRASLRSEPTTNGRSSRNDLLPVRMSSDLVTFLARSTATSTAALFVEVRSTESPSSHAFETAATTTWLFPVPGGPVMTVRGAVRSSSITRSCASLRTTGAAGDDLRTVAWNVGTTPTRCAAAVSRQSERCSSSVSSSSKALVMTELSTWTTAAALKTPVRFSISRSSFAGSSVADSESMSLATSVTNCDIATASPKGMPPATCAASSDAVAESSRLPPSRPGFR